MSEFQNVIIDGIGSMKMTTESGEPLELNQKVQHADIVYQVYRMRTKNFKLYWHLRPLNALANRDKKKEGR